MIVGNIRHVFLKNSFQRDLGGRRNLGLTLSATNILKHRKHTALSLSPTSETKHYLRFVKPSLLSFWITFIYLFFLSPKKINTNNKTFPEVTHTHTHPGLGLDLQIMVENDGKF